MTNLVTIKGDNIVGTIVPLADGSKAVLPAFNAADSAGNSLDNSPALVTSSPIQAGAAGDGSVTTSAESITVASGTQSLEFFNLGAQTIWASWTGTAAANAAGSFPIPPYNGTTKMAGYYAAPSGMYGTFSIIAESGTCAFTCIRGA